MKTKIDIISGFLGAGKTTLIKKLIGEACIDEKIAIIENEFGNVSIDGNLFKETNVSVREINSGCICCTLAGDFGMAIKEIVENYKPNRIIIEPSGVAKLSEVISACKESSIQQFAVVNMKIVVIDGTKFHLYLRNFGEFYENQIKNAKTILLSRVEFMEDSKIKDVIKEIRTLNLRAEIVTTALSELSSSRLIDIAENGDEEIEKVKIVLNRKQHMHSANDVFQVWGKETSMIFSFDALQNCVKQLVDEILLGRILRGKGILKTDKGWKNFDFVPGELSFRDAAPDFSGRLCIIGTDLKEDAIVRLFQTGELQ